jgi:hypothetical protein
VPFPTATGAVYTVSRPSMYHSRRSASDTTIRRPPARKAAFRSAASSRDNTGGLRTSPLVQSLREVSGAGVGVAL